MKSANIILISGDARMTKFMQCADVFEPSKVLGEIHEMNVKFERDTNLTEEHLSKVVQSVKDCMEQQGQIVSFVHIANYTDGKITISNQDCSIKPYFDPAIRCISDGHKWTRLYDIILHIGLKCESDNHYFIKNIG